MNTASFWDRTIPEPNTGCWLWTGPCDRKGYGRRSHQRAHRVAFAMTNGPIPFGLCVCHHCDTPQCVNPTHLFLGTQRENIRDARDKGRLWRQLNPAAQCKRGHELVDGNLATCADGRRRCLICTRANTREKARRRRRRIGLPVRGNRVAT